MKVYNRHHKNTPPGAVYCGRGSPWGNPFVIGEHGTRDEVCDRYELEILPTLDLTPLIGKDLECWCAPKRCHCDSIIHALERPVIRPRLTPKGTYDKADLDRYFNDAAKVKLSNATMAVQLGVSIDRVIYFINRRRKK